MVYVTSKEKPLKKKNAVDEVQEIKGLIGAGSERK